MKRFTDILLTAFVLWFFISWIDVIIYQGLGGTDHMWNIFKIFAALAG